MGGDNAPEAVVQGASLAAQELGVRILLVGDQRRIEPMLQGLPRDGIDIFHASDMVKMNDQPLEAVRKKKDASLVVAANCVKEGKADALVSAGSTGAVAVAALLGWGRIRGVERPAIGTVLPTQKGQCILLDVGAQVDTRATHLVRFAQMGSVYAERVLGISNPRVGLLNIGEEETKGCEVVRDVYLRLRNLGSINFIGNVEGRDILTGDADVIACDGFVGNVVLKFAEGMATTVFRFVQDAASVNWKSKLGAIMMREALRDVKTRLDANEYGGAPLLGVDGVCIIAHGSSNARAIMNAIRVGKEAVEQQLVYHIQACATPLR